MIRFAAITPHPTVIIPSIGKNNFHLARKTASSMSKIGDRFRSVKADTLIVISPHGPVQYDKFIINYSPILKGSLQSFGDERRFVLENNRELIDLIAAESRSIGIPVGFVREMELDRGTLVPLHYLISEKEKEFDCKPKLIHISVSMLPLDYHYHFGRILGKVLQALPQMTGIAASSDLSHRVSPGSPAGYSPQGRIFDRKIADLVRKKDIRSLLDLEPEFVEEAGECGLRSIVILMGAISNLRWDMPVFSYEAPFGVGYLAANMNIR